MAKQKFDEEMVRKIAELAKLKLATDEIAYLTKQFNETLKTITALKELDVDKVPGTSQVTGMTNVFRIDAVDADRILSQEAALGNSKKTIEGYFAVEGILDEK